MPVRGTTVLPDDAHAPFTPADFGFDPHDEPFAPKEFAGRLRVSSDEVLELIEDGTLQAFAVRKGKRTTYRIPFIAVVNYFLRQQRGVTN